MKLQNMKKGETTEQILLFYWALRNEDFVPELKLMFHVPNEGKRKQSTGSIMKAAGMKSGVPDICLPVARKGYHALYIELKYGNGRTTETQNDMISELKAAGNAVHVCYGFEAASALTMLISDPEEKVDIRIVATLEDSGEVFVGGPYMTINGKE